MMRESERLSREIASAFLGGWYKHHHGGPRPIGKAAITKIEQAGWDAYEDNPRRRRHTERRLSLDSPTISVVRLARQTSAIPEASDSPDA